MLVQLGRLRLEDALEDWLRVAASPAAVEVIPITPAVVAEMNRLPASFHQDPADRFISATALIYDLTLMTIDERLISAPWLPTLAN